MIFFFFCSLPHLVLPAQNMSLQKQIIPSPPLSWPKTSTSLVQMLSHIWHKTSSVPLLQGIFHLFLQLLTACNLCMAYNFLYPQKIPSLSILSELLHFHQDHEKLSDKITHPDSALGPWGWDAGGTTGICRWQGYE